METGSINISEMYEIGCNGSFNKSEEKPKYILKGENIDFCGF